MTHKIDHFAVGTSSLAAGVAALEPTLGVTVPDGSKHTLMSTHNCVMQAGNESFFELIAIDPDAPDPGRARWFTLDFPDTQNKIAERPRALCWVVSTDKLDELVASGEGVASPAELLQACAEEALTRAAGERYRECLRADPLGLGTAKLGRPRPSLASLDRELRRAG